MNIKAQKTARLHKALNQAIGKSTSKNGGAIATPPPPPPPPPKQIYAPLEIRPKLGENTNVVAAKLLAGPLVPSANAIRWFGKGTLGEDININSYMASLTDAATDVNANDFKHVEAMLISQATALNVMFGELTCWSASNLGAGKQLSTMEAYLKMALKVQNQCRMTLETLSNIKNPPVVYAKQANITNGPQQVNNGSIPHAHAQENQTLRSKLLEQSNEQRMDTGTKGQTKSGNPQLETVDSFNGT